MTGKLTINASAGDDTLTVDYSGGNPVPAGGIVFNGGDPTTGPGDKLELINGTTAKIEHVLSNESDGFVQLSGALAGKVSYFGLEPVTDNPSASDRVFTFNGGTETISLSDAVGANMKIDSTLGEVVTFANPPTADHQCGTGDDFIQIQSIDTDGPFNGDLTSMAMSATIPSFPRQP